MSFDSGKYRIKHWEGRGNTEKAGGARGEGTWEQSPRQLLSQVPLVSQCQENAGFSECHLAEKSWASFWSETSHFPLPLILSFCFTPSLISRMAMALEYTIVRIEILPIYLSKRSLYPNSPINSGEQGDGSRWSQEGNWVDRSRDGLNWVEGESKIGWLKAECPVGNLCSIFHSFGSGPTFCPKQILSGFFSKSS